MKKLSACLVWLCPIIICLLFSCRGKGVRGQAEEDGISLNSSAGSSTADTLISVSKDRRWGFIDADGRCVISPQFDEVGSFRNGLSTASIVGERQEEGFLMGSKWGFIDITGKWVINPQFDAARQFEDGLAAASTGGRRTESKSLIDRMWFDVVGSRWGFITNDGKWAIEPRYDYVKSFVGGMAAAGIGGKPDNDGSFIGSKWGVIDVKGNWVIEPKYDEIKIPNKGLIAAAVGGKADKKGYLHGSKWGFINKEGKWIIDPRFDKARLFWDGIAAASTGGKLDSIGEFRGSKWGFIDGSGNWIIRPQFDDAFSFENGFAPTSTGGKLHYIGIFGGSRWGIIDRSGQWVTSPQFDEVHSYEEGLAPAQIGGKLFDELLFEGGKWGYIDNSGRWVINPQFDDVGSFDGDLASACIRSGKPDMSGVPTPRWGIIDKSGRWRIGPEFDEIPILESGFIKGSKNGAMSVFDHSGRNIWNEIEKEKTESQTQEPNTVGSGFYVSAEGHVLTNSHVVHAAKRIRISGSDAEILSEDQLNDLALLRVSMKPAYYATFSKTVANVGEEVCTYGFPLTGILASSGSLSVGTISSLSGIANNVSQIQVSVPVQPGNSGGPLLSRKGHVVGVIVGKLDEATVSRLTGHIPENVNFAASVATVKAFLDVNKVPYRGSGLLSLKKSNERIAAEAQKYTVKVECFR